MMDSYSTSQNEANGAVPDVWLHSPPSSLVVGDGAYARALAGVLEGARLTSEMLQRGPEPLPNGSFPSVLDSVERVLLSVPETPSASEVIWQHDRVCHWIEVLTSAADYHEVGFVVVVGDKNAGSLDAAFRDNFGPSSLRDSKGITLWQRTKPLRSLLNALTTVGRTDIQRMRSLRANQPKRQALVQLKSAVLNEMENEILNGANNVAVVFERDQLALDNFCNPPLHKNGNAWRQWISRVVTEGVTQELRTRVRELVPTLNV